MFYLYECEMITQSNTVTNEDGTESVETSIVRGDNARLVAKSADQSELQSIVDSDIAGKNFSMEWSDGMSAKVIF